MIGDFRYSAVGRVRFGAGALGLLAEELVALGAERAFLVAAPSAEGDAVARVHAAMGARRAGTFAQTRPHAPYATVLAAAAAARDASADAVVSVGGGSVIDTARLVALCVAEGLATDEELHARRARGGSGVVLPDPPLRALPHVAVPTTLSAAEYSDGAAATGGEPLAKQLFIGAALATRTVLVDPTLALLTPAPAWVTTGMRAVDHAVESLCSPNRVVVVEELAMAALRRLHDALPRALDEPDSVAARAAGQEGAWMSFFGVASGTLGLSHAIGHQLGGRLGVPHGVASAIVLPHVLRRSDAEDGLRAVAEALGAADAATGVEDLSRRLHLPQRLGDLGLELTDEDALADAVLADVLLAGADPPLTRDNVLAILRACA